MRDAIRIRELTEEADIRAAFPVMHELRDQLDEETFLELLPEMQTRGYRLIALEEDEKIVALAGIARGTNFYYGRYIWVYDLVTTSAARSRGHGLRLLRHLERLARDEGCDTVALSSGLQRLDAHRFYLDKAGYEKASFTFRKDVRPGPS